MIRRSFLKLILASPLAGFLKKKEPEGLKVKQLLECDLKGAKPDKDGMIELTTGTSGEEDPYFWSDSFTLKFSDGNVKNNLGVGNEKEINN